MVAIASCCLASLLGLSASSASAGTRRDVAANMHAQPAISSAVTPAGAHDAAAVASQMSTWLDAVEDTGAVAGLSVAVVHGDKVLLERGIGYADWATRAPVTPTTVFRLASLSKAFATALSGILVQRGTLHWDTRIANVLPKFALSNPSASKRLNVADILSHRVGLPHNTYDLLLENDEPYPLLVAKLKDVPMACPVGDCYGYQNVAFSLIGDVVYATTGDFFYHQVEKYLFHPLGMKTATYGRDALETSASWARPHRRAGRGWKPFLPNENYYHVAPAAGVNASIRDMEQWLIAQMGGRPDVLSPALLTKLHAPLVETAHQMRSSPWRRGRLLDAKYALGWRVYDYAGETLIFHAGAVQGYRSMIGFLPKYRFGVVMLWNNETALPAGLLPMLFDRFLGLPETNWAGIEDVDEDLSSGRG